MNKFLALVCCLASLASARPDVSLGYHYDPNYNSGAELLSAPFTSTSYSGAASGSGYNTGAASGSVNFLAPNFNVAGYSSGGSSSYSSGSSLSGSGGLGIVSGGLSSGSGLGYSSGSGLSGSGLTYSSGSGLSSSGLGYSSGAGLSSSGLGYSSGLSSGYNSGSLGLGSGSIGYNTVGLGSGYATGANQGFIGGGGLGLGVNQGADFSQQQYAAQFAQLQAPIITKSFYVHSAPEDHDEQQIVRYVTIGRPVKNYRVLFINAPSSTSTRAKIIARVAPVEDRTAVYVLSKKTNDLDISADVVTPAPVAPAKPDVFFIKYKTPQEAVHAQHVIQAQYDQLGGSSSYSNEGFVPVQSVIGSLGQTEAVSTGNNYNAVVGGVGGAGLIGGGAVIADSGLSGGSFGSSGVSGGSFGGSGLSGTLIGTGGGSFGSSGLSGGVYRSSGLSGGSFGSSGLSGTTYRSSGLSGSFGQSGIISGGGLSGTSQLISAGSGDSLSSGFVSDQSSLSDSKAQVQSKYKKY